MTEQQQVTRKQNTKRKDQQKLFVPWLKLQTKQDIEKWMWCSL